MYIFSLVMITAQKKNWNNNLNILNSYGIGDLENMTSTLKLNISEGFNYVEGLDGDIGIVKVVLSFAKTVNDGSIPTNKTADVNAQNKTKEEVEKELIANVYETIGEVSDN